MGKGKQMPTRAVQVNHEGGIAVVSLQSRERQNVLDAAMLETLMSVFSKLKGDSGVRGVAITGHDKVFSVGIAPGENFAMSPREAAAFSEQGQRLMFAIEQLGKPVIAAVNGSAAGAGLELALACDFIVCSESASFGFPEVKAGLIPAFGGTQRLVRLVGKARAKEMIFTGDMIGSRDAFDIGLVTRIYDDEELRGATIRLLDKICSRGPLSLRMAKEVIDAGHDIDLATACLMERHAFALCFTTEEQKEGMVAFIEKRKPHFSGK